MSHQKFTLHVVGLAHTQTTRAYSNCAYTEKVRKFCDMMTSLDHTVYLYASEDNDAACDELITCITKQEQQDMVGVFGPEDVLKAPFDASMPHWTTMNKRATEAISERSNDRDFICLIAGLCQKSIADASPGRMAVEFGVGYPGTFSNYKAYESYAWMHIMYGNATKTPGGVLGSNYDRVIPNYFEPDLFPKAENLDDYLLFIGRLNEDKGVGIAIETAEAVGSRLIVAGQGGFNLPDWVEYRGLVGPTERGELMSKAKATFVPTLYVEPFGGVHVESMLCGTPVITTDWGVFTETVEQGKVGFRCRTFQEFVDAANSVHLLDRDYIRERAQRLWSADQVRWQYQKWFEELHTLYAKGWYTLC